MKYQSKNRQLLLLTLFALLLSILKCGMTDMAGSMAGAAAAGATGAKEEEEPVKEENPQKLSVLQEQLTTTNMINDIDTTISEIKDKMSNIEIAINGRLNEIEKTGNQFIQTPLVTLKLIPKVQFLIIK
jgi:hypothetical protein